MARRTVRGGHHHGDAARFDRWARTYDRVPGQLFFRSVHRPVIHELTRLSARGAARTVLDVGCGTGRLLEALLPLLPDAELIGVDPAPGMASVARDRFRDEPRVRIELAAAERLPLSAASVDAATTTLSFHHWDDQTAALAEIARVLRPGGRLLVADILGIGPIGRMLRPQGTRHGAGYRNEAELTELLRGSGFSAWRRRWILVPGIPVLLVEARRDAQRLTPPDAPA